MSVSAYCIDAKKSGGVHKLHNLQACHDLNLPAPEHRVDLGHHYNVHSAFKKAKELFETIECCAYCCGHLLS